MDKAIEIVKEEMKIYNNGEGGVASWGAYTALGLLLEKLVAAQQCVERTLSKSSEAVPGVAGEIEELWAGE